MDSPPLTDNYFQINKYLSSPWGGYILPLESLQSCIGAVLGAFSILLIDFNFLVTGIFFVIPDDRSHCKAMCTALLAASSYTWMKGSHTDTSQYYQHVPIRAPGHSLYKRQ